MTLADRFIPNPEFSETHSISISAPREVVWEAVRAHDPTASRLARPLFAARALIGRVAHGTRRQTLPASGMFTTLAEEPGHQVVFGIVGRWWRFGGSDSRADVDGPEPFVAFDEPGYAKGTFDFLVTDDGPGRTRLTTQTRVVTTDTAAHQVMARYWLLIRPGSGAIRRVMLASIRRRALRRTLMA